MDDLGLRLALIGGALVLAGMVVMVLRRRAANPVRSIDAHGFDAGVYFFSSATCETCIPARERLDSALGPTGYTEVKWEEEPAQFQRLYVDVVPAVMLVDDRARGRLYPGQPDRALRSRGVK